MGEGTGENECKGTSIHVVTELFLRKVIKNPKPELDETLVNSKDYQLKVNNVIKFPESNLQANPQVSTILISKRIRIIQKLDDAVSVSPQ